MGKARQRAGTYNPDVPTEMEVNIVESWESQGLAILPPTTPNAWTEHCLQVEGKD